MVEHGRNIFFAKQNFFFQKWFTTLLLSRGFLNSSQLFFSVRGSKVVPFGLEKNKHKRLFWFRCFSDKQAKLSLGKMLFGCCWLKKHKHLMNKWPIDQNNIQDISLVRHRNNNLFCIATLSIRQFHTPVLVFEIPLTSRCANAVQQNHQEEYQ
jgi:hypothetical protein